MYSYSTREHNYVLMLRESYSTYTIYTEIQYRSTFFISLFFNSYFSATKIQPLYCCYLEGGVSIIKLACNFIKYNRWWGVYISAPPLVFITCRSIEYGIWKFIQSYIAQKKGRSLYSKFANLGIIIQIIF